MVEAIVSEQRNSTPKKRRVAQNKAERLNRFVKLDATLQPKTVGVQYRVQEAANPTDSKWVGKVGRLIGETPSKNGRETDLLVLQFADRSKDVFSRSQLVEIGGVEPDEFHDVRQKLCELEGYLSDLSSSSKRHKEPDASALIEYRTIQATEAITQTMCLIAGFGGRRVERKEGIGILIQLGVIDPSTRAKFRHLNLIRNRLVHHRDTVGAEEVIRVLPKLIKVGEQFIADVTVFLENTTAELLETRLKEITRSNVSVAMTAREAAQRLGVSIYCIQRWVRVKKLDGFRYFDGNLQVRRSGVESLYNTLPQWYRNGMP